MTTARSKAQPSSTRLIAGALFLAALLVRLANVNHGFWYDEIFSLTHFFRAPWPDLFSSLPDPNHHPLYSLLAKLSLLGLGEAEWTARLPALLAGAGSVPLLFYTGQRFLSRRAGVIAAMLLGLNMWHVYYSTDARGYSLMVLLSLVSWHVFLVMIEDGPRPSLAALYAATSGAMLYTHLYSVAVPAGHLAAALVLHGLERRWPRRDLTILILAPLAGLAAGFLLYLPMLADLTRFIATEGQIIRTREFSLEFILGLFCSWASGGDRLALSLPALILAGAGAAVMAREKPAVLLTWLLPLVIAFVIPLVSRTFVYHRFYAFAMPGFFLAAGLAVDAAVRKLKLPAWSWAVVAAVLAGLLLPELVGYYRQGKQGLRPAAEWIRKNAPGAKALSLGLAREEFRYYCPEAAVVGKDDPLDPLLLSNAVVVFAFPWSVSPERQRLLERVCGRPLIFTAAGYPENELRLYRCGVDAPERE